MPDSLGRRSAEFASEVQASLNGVLPGDVSIVAVSMDAGDRYSVRPSSGSVPIHVDGEYLADLRLLMFLSLDHTGRYLKTLRSDLAIHSVLDRTPLLRLEFRSDMHTAPIAHWQIHAERGAFSHLLARAHAHRPELVARPHDLSSLHLPVGGKRFRPCLEDLLEFLVVECGVDTREGWQAAIHQGRASWRRRQLASAVRDIPEEAARSLREAGWEVPPPDSGSRQARQQTLSAW